MLRRKIRLGKKAMDWGVLVGIILALFAALIIIIMFTSKIKQVQGVNDDCEKAGGSCVERSSCAACGSLGDCKAGFNSDLICQICTCLPEVFIEIRKRTLWGC
jgi:hypothetical protein